MRDEKNFTCPFVLMLLQHAYSQQTHAQLILTLCEIDFASQSSVFSVVLYCSPRDAKLQNNAFAFLALFFVVVGFFSS